MEFQKRPERFLEKDLLVGLITSDILNQKLQPINPELFEHESFQKLVHLEANFWQKYEKAPGVENFKKLFNDNKAKFKEGDQTWVDGIVEELEKPQDVNFEDEFTIDRFSNYLHSRTLKVGAEKIIELIERNKKSEAQEIASALQKSCLAIAKKPKIYTAKQVGRMSLPEPSWLVKGIIPEGLTIICGKPKVGKSYFGFNLCMSIVKGEKAFGIAEVKEGSVLYIDLEDPLSRIKNRMYTMVRSYDFPENLFVSPMGEWSKWNEGGINQLKQFLEEHLEVVFVFIDGFERIRGRAHGYDYGESYSIIASIQELSWVYETAIMISHHYKKGRPLADEVFDYMLGSTGDFGACDTATVLTEHNRGQADAIFHVKGKDVGYLEFAFAHNDFNWKHIGTAREARLTPERKDILDLIREKQPIRREDIVKMRGDIKGTDNLLAKMVKEGYLDKLGYGVYIEKGWKPKIEEEWFEFLEMNSDLLKKLKKRGLL